MAKRIRPEDMVIRSIPDYEGAGIYMLKNTITGKVYIGSARNIRQRIIQHDQSFRHMTCNQKFLPDVQKGHKFDCIIIEKYDNITFVELRNKEHFFVEKYDSFHTGYNIAGVPTYELKYFQKGTYMYDWLTRKV